MNSIICDCGGKHELRNCPSFILERQRMDLERRAWNEAHSCCPDCGNNQLMHTLAGAVHYSDRPYSDDINNAECDCGWNGKVNKLVAKK